MINVPDIEVKLQSLRQLIEERLPQERAKL
jgi:hypothetical protein